MTGLEVFVALGMCSGYHPTDAQMTRDLCRMQFEASLRPVEAFNTEMFIRAREIEKAILTGSKDPYPPLPYRKRPESNYLATLRSGLVHQLPQDLQRSI